MDPNLRLLFVEPFDVGSHRAFRRALTDNIDAQWTTLTMPGRHWKWRMRGSALYLAQKHAEVLAQPYDLIFASSYLPLTELKGLVPNLAPTPAVLYFHENQFAYPTRDVGKHTTDHHYGLSQLVSAMSADAVVFNSDYNRQSFLEQGQAFLRMMRDCRVPEIIGQIEARSAVLGVPLDLPDDPIADTPRHPDGPLVLWNHRWEYDKNPEAFFAAVADARQQGLPFRIAVCGQQFRNAPDVFATAQAEFADITEHWGWLESRADYVALLQRADIAVSTAIHEFFGVAMLEATHYGAQPLVPDRLAYPELFPEACRYGSDEQLVRDLVATVQAWHDGQPTRSDRRHLTHPHRPQHLLPRYEALIEQVTAS